MLTWAFHEDPCEDQCASACWDFRLGEQADSTHTSDNLAVHFQTRALKPEPTLLKRCTVKDLVLDFD